jgi:hypothetical protein
MFRMPSSRVLGALFCALFLLAPTACDDPTSVGGELVEREGAGPQRVELPLDVDTVQYAPITGSARISESARFLAGQTSGDPLGDVTATGYVDFAPSLSEIDPADRAIDSVQFRMRPARDAFYGDTTQATPLALYDLKEEWEAAGARADTSLPNTVEPQRITTFSVAPGDSLVTASLPSDWIRRNDEQLRQIGDSTFTEAFHGFQVRPVDGGESVAGFLSRATTLRVVFETGGDEEALEASAPLTRQLTTIRQPDPQQPKDRYVIQKGTGRALAFRFALPDSLRSAAVNSATLVLETDSVLAGTGSDYARPRFSQLDVYDTTDDSLALLSGNRPQAPAALALSNDRTRFDVANFSLSRFVQDALLGTSDIERFQLRPGPLTRVLRVPRGSEGVNITSLGSALIRRADGHRPRLVLFYTSTE